MTNGHSMSKRVGITLPDTIHDKLGRWAKAEGRPLANLCNFLLEKAVREAEEKGDIPPPAQEGQDS
jgi:predicted DNA-binding protein